MSYRGRRSRTKLFVILLFIIILLLLVLTAFKGNLFFTGKVVGEKLFVNESSVGEGKIPIKASLGIPYLELDGNFESIELETRTGGFILVGKQKVELRGSGKNYISFRNYGGKIFFDSSKISVLSGKAEKIFVNGIPFSSVSNKSTKIGLDGDLEYSYLELKDSVEIGKLSYTTSGVIEVDERKEIFNVDNEEIVLSGFKGNAIFEDDFSLKGYIDKLVIEGDIKTIVSS